MKVDIEMPFSRKSSIKLFHHDNLSTSYAEDDHGYRWGFSKNIKIFSCVYQCLLCFFSSFTCWCHPVNIYTCIYNVVNITWKAQ